MKLTQERLKELLHYCPALGLFWWKERDGNDRHTKRWNTRYANQIAGSLSADGYPVVTLEKAPRPLHRLAWLWMTGEWPSGEVDHANTWKLDNAWDNLREATRSQNSANRPSRSRSGFKGVYRKPSGRYQAMITNHKIKERLGTYDTPEEAHSAFMARAVEIHGEFARA